MKKIYKVVFEDYKGVYREYIPAKNKAEIAKIWGGNGEIISLVDITDKYPININKVRQALTNNGFGDIEIDVITRTLQMELDNTI